MVLICSQNIPLGRPVPRIRASYLANTPFAVAPEISQIVHSSFTGHFTNDLQRLCGTRTADGPLLLR